jgi:RNA polymerase sigma-70 factor (ECF subfamily)
LHARCVTNEEACVRRAQQGDLNAFNELVIEYRDRVYTHCLYTLRHPENAEEATQEAFIKAWRSIRSLRGSFKPWIMTIATNACRDLIRALKPVEPLPGGGDDPRPDLPSADPGPEGEAVLSELQSEVRLALQQLPPEQGQAILLCDLMELDYAEAARSLGISIGTVKSRIFRGREKLRQLLTREQLYGVAGSGAES